MRITLVYHQFLRRGGLEGYLLEFVRRLHAAGHSLRLVANRIDDEGNALAEEVHLIPQAWNRTATMRRFAEESARVVENLRDGPVLGFGRTWAQDVHRAGGGCHLVYSGMLPWWKRWRPRNRLELGLERRLYTGGRTRLFVVNSRMVAAELQRHYDVPASRIRVIHTAVDSSRWRPGDPEEREAVRRQLGLPDDRPVLLFASLDHRRKGLDTLIRALSAVPDALLLVAGKPVGRWRAAIDRAGLAPRVRELGNIDLLPAYRAADWFVHPTRYDACANTVLQSLACGLPGIISASDGASEFIRHGQNGFVLADPADDAALAGLIRDALQIPAGVRAGMSESARETAAALTWEAHLDAWMDAISGVGDGH